MARAVAGLLGGAVGVIGQIGARGVVGHRRRIAHRGRAGQTGAVRDWVVGGGLIVSDEGLLLVRNRRRNGSHDWSPPGGVIDEGESIVGGLTREVQEETGLRVTSWAGPVYEVTCHAPDMGWRLRVEAHLALEVEGDLHVDDPDGIVVEAAYVDPGGCADHLAACPRWVRDPLAAWLEQRWDAGEARPFGFHVAGTDLASLRVTPLEP